MNAYASERYVDMSISFGLIDTSAADDAETSVSSNDGLLTQLAQVTNEVETGMTSKMATLEPGYFILDDKAELIPDDISDYQTGWHSESLSDAEGDIDETLTFAFDTAHDSIGFTVYFDTVASEYATEFTVSTYNADGLIETKTINNSESICRVGMPTLDYTSVVFNFTKTLYPNRRIKIAQVLFGIIQEFGRRNLKQFSLLRQISFDSLCTSDLRVTFDNQNRAYNMTNPTGIYAYLQQAQELDIKVGIGPDKDSLEWENLGKYYYIGSESEDESLTATIKGADLIYLLENAIYDGYADSTDALINVLNDVLAATGRIITKIIPADVQSITIFRRLPEKTDCRKLVEMIADAGMCAAYVDRDNRLIFTKLEEAENVDDTLTEDRMYAWPKIIVPKYKNGATMEIDDVVYTVGEGFQIKADNPLVTGTNATAYLNWKVRNAQAFTYKLRTPGNPERDIVDTAAIYDYYGTNRKAVITKSELTFSQDAQLVEVAEALGRDVV